MFGESHVKELQKFRLPMTLWEEECRVFQKTFVINWYTWT